MIVSQDVILHMHGLAGDSRSFLRQNLVGRGSPFSPFSVEHMKVIRSIHTAARAQEEPSHRATMYLDRYLAPWLPTSSPHSPRSLYNTIYTSINIPP